VIVLVSIAIAVVFGVLLIAYYICKRTKGNITFSDPEKILHDCLVELLETYIAANKMMNKERYDVYPFNLNKKSC
jgi:hypothetical protein